MVIRPAAEPDFDTMTAITNRVIATSATHFAYLPLQPGELAALWRDHPRFPWLVLEDASGVRGYAKAGTWRTRDAYAWICETTIHMAEGARGHGLGRTLYTALLDEVVRRGFRSAIAGIALPNPASVALHEKLGFTSVGVVEDAGWKLGAWHAVGFWQKRFATGPEPPTTAAT